MTVNHDVTGSSPVGGATSGQEESCPDSLFVADNLGAWVWKNVNRKRVLLLVFTNYSSFPRCQKVVAFIP